MKTPPPDPALVQIVGQPEALSNRCSPTMKRGIETGHLGNVRAKLHDRPDTCQVVRLMQRRQGNQLLEFRQDLCINQRRFNQVLTSMNHAVTNRQWGEGVAVMLANPAGQMGECFVMTHLLAGGAQVRIRQNRASPILCFEFRRRAQTFDLSA